MSLLKRAIFNPVMVKELRLRWRTPKAPTIIALYLVVYGAIILFQLYDQSYRNGTFQLGQSRSLFMTLVLLQTGLISFVAPGLSAGMISGERERQTLNTLLTTNLSPLQIVASKLTSSISFVALLIVSALPMYAIVFQYGGVAPSQLFGTLLLNVFWVLVFGSIGIACSAWFKRTGISTIVAYLLVFSIIAGGFIMGMFSQDLFWHPERYPNHPILNDNRFFQTLPIIFQGLSPVHMMVYALGDGQFISAVPHGLNPIDPYFTNPLPIFLIVYPLLVVGLIWFSVRMIRPTRESKWRWGKK